MTLELHHDKGNLLGAIQQKADLLRRGHAAGMAAAPKDFTADGLLFAGMGGSGATAHLVRDACTRAMPNPFTIVQHYQIPHHVQPGWHTVALSYSGATEETLTVVRDAKARGVGVTGFSTGGQLADLADNLVRQPTGFQPRVALGHAWFSVLGWLEGTGMLTAKTPVEAAAAAVEDIDATCGPEVDEAENPAKQLARRLIDKIPQIYATPAFQGTALFFRCQLNENAKKIAGVEMVPECNHNDIMGWGGDPMRRHFTAVALSHAEQNPQIQARLEFMEELYGRLDVPWHHHRFGPVHSYEDHVIEQARGVQFADYVSFYLAMMRGIDPSEIAAIKALKAHLAD